jgi:hypothetical protein
MEFHPDLHIRGRVRDQFVHEASETHALRGCGRTEHDDLVRQFENQRSTSS